MKRSVFVFLGIFLFLVQVGFAQSGKKKPQAKVPPVVLETFSAKYPGLEVKEWDWEAQKETFEAKFMDGEKKKKAIFTPEGKWVHTKMKIMQAELPEAVLKTATSGDLEQWQLLETEQFESEDKGTYYKIRFKKGQEQQVLKFDAAGNRMEKKGAGLKTVQ